jgi:DNA polymerase III alpha subunit (gram-positive type)
MDDLTPEDRKNILKQPTFKDKYEELKLILEQPDTVICGHGIDSDVNFLLKATQRYELPQFSFKAIDTLPILEMFLKDYNLVETMKSYLLVNKLDGFTRLRNIAKYFDLPSRVAHQALNDVLTNIDYVKYICAKYELDLTQIIERYTNQPHYKKICARNEAISQITDDFINGINPEYEEKLDNVFTNMRFSYKGLNTVAFYN